MRPHLYAALGFFVATLVATSATADRIRPIKVALKKTPAGYNVTVGRKKIQVVGVASRLAWQSPLYHPVTVTTAAGVTETTVIEGADGIVEVQHRFDSADGRTSRRGRYDFVGEEPDMADEQIRSYTAKGRQKDVWREGLFVRGELKQVRILTMHLGKTIAKREYFKGASMTTRNYFRKDGSVLVRKVRRPATGDQAAVETNVIWPD